MRTITGLLLLTGFAGTAMAHTGDGILLTALFHQLFGLHHLPFSILLIVAAVFAIRRWQSSKRAD
jgi:predicted transporter